MAEWVKLHTAVYYNDYRGLIHNDFSAPLTNGVDAYQHGLELGFDFLLTNWLTSFVNYTYQNFNRDDFSSYAVDPPNMCNAGLRTICDKWTSNLVFHYVDRFYEIYDAANPVLGFLSNTGPQKVDPYTTIDLRVAYTPINNLEFALTAANLFEDKHYESNPIPGLAGVGADEIGRRITGTVSCKF